MSVRSESETDAVELPEPELFSHPDWSEPLDTETRLESAPAKGMVKGWLLKSVVRRADQRGITLTEKKYHGFRSYPVQEYLRLLDQAAQQLEPKVPPKETLRRLGHEVYPAFRDSTVGRVVLAGFGEQGDASLRGLRWLSKGYRVASPHTRVRAAVVEPGHALLHLDRVWSFPDSYHVGIFQGAAEGHWNSHVDIKTYAVSPCEVWLDLRWARGSQAPKT